MLGELITSKTRLRLLIKFFVSQANRGYLNGLATEMGESTNAIRKELNHLHDAGYLQKEKSNNKIQYKANTKHPMFSVLAKGNTQAPRSRRRRRDRFRANGRRGADHSHW